MASFPSLVLCVRVSFVDPSPFYKAPGVCLLCVCFGFFFLLHPPFHPPPPLTARQTKPYPTLLFDTIKTIIITFVFPITSHHTLNQICLCFFSTPPIAPDNSKSTSTYKQSFLKHSLNQENSTMAQAVSNYYPARVSPKEKLFPSFDNIDHYPSADPADGSWVSDCMSEQQYSSSEETHQFAGNHGRQKQHFNHYQQDNSMTSLPTTPKDTSIAIQWRSHNPYQRASLDAAKDILGRVTIPPPRSPDATCRLRRRISQTSLHA